MQGSGVHGARASRALRRASRIRLRRRSPGAAARQRRRIARRAGDGARVRPGGHTGGAARRIGPARAAQRHGGALQPHEALVRAPVRVPGERLGDGAGREGRIARRGVLPLRRQPRDRALHGLAQDRGPPREGEDVAATATVRQGGTAQLSFNLPRAPHRRRPASGPTATCSAPPAAPRRRSSSSPTSPPRADPVSTRGWIAWYTPASGWHWHGNLGENAAAGTRGRRRAAASPSSTPTARSRRRRGRGDRSASRPARASSPPASTRSSTGPAGARRTAGSTSTRASPEPSPPAARTRSASIRELRARVSAR